MNNVLAFAPLILLFWIGLSKSGATSNQTFSIDELSMLISRIFKTTINRAQDEKRSPLHSSNKYLFIVETTVDAKEAWAKEVVSRSSALASLCPPRLF